MIALGVLLVLFVVLVRMFLARKARQREEATRQYVEAMAKPLIELQKKRQDSGQF